MNDVMVDRWDWWKAAVTLFDTFVWTTWVVLTMFTAYIALADHWVPIASGA
jgi:hypothetical protein